MYASNFERLQNMSLEEMAEILALFMEAMDDFEYDNNVEFMKQWLLSEPEQHAEGGGYTAQKVRTK